MENVQNKLAKICKKKFKCSCPNFANDIVPGSIWVRPFSRKSHEQQFPSMRWMTGG